MNKASKMLKRKLLGQHNIAYWTKYPIFFKSISKSNRLFQEHVMFYKTTKYIFGICNLNLKIKGRKE